MTERQPCITQECATPGCHTMIRFTIGTQIAGELCKWCQQQWEPVLGEAQQNPFPQYHGDAPALCRCCHASPEQILWSNRRQMWTCVACHASELTCCTPAARPVPDEHDEITEHDT